MPSCGGTHGHGSATISVGNLVVDLSRNYAKVGETRLELTAKEFRIIEFLALRKGAVLSKDAFLNHLYGGIDEPEPKIIDVFICKLRRKLVENGAEGLSVDTVWGQGYILRERAIIRCLKKRASRHPLFVEAVPAPSNSPPVWTGLAHSLTATPALPIS
jgi:DNA-binding winged helix-turn-helix (wHTH) protein